MAATETEFDLAIIGAGPGGYTAAIRAAQLGMKVACIEKEGQLGGTCLRVGCIPSKTLLEATAQFALVRERLAPSGITCDKVQMDLAALLARKDHIVATLSHGVAGLFRKNRIERINATASFVSANELQIAAAGGRRLIRAARVLIATGSAPIELPNMPFDARRVISSDQAIALRAVPKRMVVIGAGAIGLELSSVWKRLGADVTVLEIYHSTLPGADEEMGRLMERTLKGQGLKFHFGVQATGLREEKGRLSVRFAPSQAGLAENESALPADVVLVAVGRRAYTQGLDLDKAGVATDQRGRILVNRAWQTSVSNIYAIGDVIAGPMLAHKAQEEGIAVAELMAGKAGHVNYDTIPLVVYTSPELAWVGKTQEQLQAAGVQYNVGKFRFAANARALCMDETQGMVKILADKHSDRILGVHILGPQASSLIAQAVMAMELGASSEDIARTCHAHPSLPEALREAALAVEGRTINA